MSERWLPVVGFEGRYEVSDLGRVRVVDHLTQGKSCRGQIFNRRVTAKVLRPGLTSVGYPSVSLGRGRTKLVHRLVLEAFVGAPLPGQEVLHRDGKRDNARLSNLHYGTRSENNCDIFIHGNRKVGGAELREIRRRLAVGYTGVSIAKEFGLSGSMISAIKHKKHYGRIK